MSRLSSIYTTGGSSSTYSGRRNHLLIQKDEFPILDFKEISVCLQTCDFIANEELISKPTSQYIRSLFEQLLDAFMAIPADHISRKVRSMTNHDSSMIRSQETEDELNNNNNNDQIANDSASKDDAIEEDDTNNTLGLLVLFRASYIFLQTCGVYDFSLVDIMKPEAQRTRRILSAVVNYARFREQQSKECEVLAVSSEANIEEIRRLKDLNNKYSNDINELREKLQAGTSSENGDDPNRKTALKQINIFNYRLENELKKLQKAQQILTLEHSQYKEQKQRLIEKLEDHHYLNLESSKELDKLKGYLSTNPEMLKKVIDDLKNTLTDCQSTYTNFENSYRNKSATIDSIQIIEQELKNLFRILEEILNDITRSDASIDKLTKYQEFLEQQKIQSNDLNRQIQQLKRQLTNLEEKIRKLRNQSNERDKKAKDNLVSLKNDYEELVEERKVKEFELDKKKELITNLEKQMSSKRNEFQIEVRNAETAVSRLTAHLKLYLTEMNNKSQ